MKYTREVYLEMLTYMRPAYSRYNQKFCRRYIQPVFGQPDKFGNYIKIIGDKPKVAFMAHHDTVHRYDGRTSVRMKDDYVYCHTQDCLGADDTTGVFIILSMVAANVPGVYVIHAAEEIGCIGSKNLVKSRHDFLKYVDFAISLDRKGCTSIITHQASGRTCSDAFADSLNTILGGGFVKDSGGVYTDSNEYVDDIAECTNLSVGYYNMHSKKEHQDLEFIDILVNKMIKADWSQLVKKREPGDCEYDDFSHYYQKGYPVTKSSTNSHFKGNPKHSAKESAKTFLMNEFGDESAYYAEVFGRNTYEVNHPKDEVTLGLEIEDMMQVIKKYPEEVAIILNTFGYNPSGLIDDCDDLAVKNNKSYGRVMSF
jgi:hypothetical protein